MATVIGVVLTLILLLLTLATLWLAWHRPLIGMGVLVAGMAFHSFLLMALLGLHTPVQLVRVFQVWKEVLLAVLTVVALLTVWRNRRTGILSDLTPTDWLAIGLGALTVIYLLIPASALHSSANFTQRVLGFRVLALIPLLYFLGRTLAQRAGRDLGDLATALWLCLGAGAIVALFGLVELWLVPTRDWITWGVNLYTKFLGFTYNGPGGLPENFFVTLADGTLVRRMVSTYISPLGIAYTGLLLLPLGVVLVDRRPQRRWTLWLAGSALALMLVGLMLSVTRLAVLLTVPEAALLALLLRRPWLVGLTGALAAAAALTLLAYPSAGPVVTRASLATGGHATPQLAVSANDVSATEHIGQLKLDLELDLQHPLGLGVGASQNRFGQLVGTGESAVLGMFGDMGVLGGLLYVALYLAALWNGYRAFRLSPPGSLLAALPLTALVGGLALIPVTMTSDVWGDLSVTFLFWWAAGASATQAARAVTVRAESRRRVVATSSATLEPTKMVDTEHLA
jgi:hypothetical protein